MNQHFPFSFSAMIIDLMHLFVCLVYIAGNIIETAEKTMYNAHRRINARHLDGLRWEFVHPLLKLTILDSRQ